MYKCLTYRNPSRLVLVTCWSAINDLQRLTIRIKPGDGGTRSQFYTANGVGECVSPLYGAGGALGTKDQLQLANCHEQAEHALWELGVGF